MSDTKLLEQFRNGDSGAFTYLYKRYYDPVLRYSCRLLNDDQTAKDVAQNVFLKLHSENNSIRQTDLLKSWLFTVARNEAFEYLRKVKPIEVSEDVMWEGEIPDEELLNKERNEILRSILNNLHTAYREVIVLREYEQLSYQEIASIMVTTVSSVKSRLFKARKALIEKMKPYLLK